MGRLPRGGGEPGRRRGGNPARRRRRSLLRVAPCRLLYFASLRFCVSPCVALVAAAGVLALQAAALSAALPLSVAGGHCAACARQRASLFAASFSVLCSCSSVRLSGRRRKREGELSPLAFRFYLFPSPLLREHCEDCAVAAAVLVGSVPIPQLPVFICNGQGSVSYFSVLCDSPRSLHCALFVGLANPPSSRFSPVSFFLLRFCFLSLL